MERFTQLFADLLVFVYHCFDRIVIHGYLSGLSRPEQVVYFFRQVLGIPAVDKEVLSQRTNDYRGWVEAYARNHKIPMEWAEKGTRKEDYVLPALRRMEKKNAYGVYFIFKSMEQGRTFRISVPRFPTQDPNHRILAHQRSRFTHYYFYIRDEVLGPIIVRVASFFPFHATYWLNGHSFMERELNRKRIGFHKNDNAFLAVDDVAQLQAAADRLSAQIIRKQLDYWTFLLGPKFSKKERGQMNLSRFYAIAQIEYCRNFIFKRHFPIHKIFERSCEIGLWRLTANRISEIFGVRLNKRLRGKLATVLDQIEHGHHVFRAYWKNAFLKQYEKFSCFLRNELCSNNLRDFGLKKGLDHLDAVRKHFQAITDRFAGFQAQCLNVHVDFPLLQRLALPVTIGSVRHPGIKIHDVRIIRLLEVLLHGGNTLGGLDCQTDPWSRPHYLPTLLENLRAEPTLLRSPQAERPWAPGTRRFPLRLPSHRQRTAGRAPVPVLPQAALRSAGQQPLPPSARSEPPARQQARSRVPQSRHGHPGGRRPARRCLMLPAKMLKYSGLRSSI
jgi:hypothetical protein